MVEQDIHYAPYSAQEEQVIKANKVFKDLPRDTMKKACTRIRIHLETEGHIK